MNTITLRRWFDRHLHLRDGEMLHTVLPCTLKQHATGAVIMGNLPPPHHTSTIKTALAYKERIKKALPEGSDFQPRMTLYLTDEITPEEVVEGFRGDAWCAVKLYMAKPNGEGGTTNASHGVKNFRGRYRVFEAMEKHCIPLLGHWEAVDDEVDHFDREIISVERDLQPLRRAMPGLPIVFEHVSDGRAAEYVVDTPNLYATVTPQHMILNRNALFDGGLNPAHYCLPVLKREEHRLKVRELVTSGNRSFGAGTDSAAHDAEAKSRCYGCSAGIFTAPVAVELYAKVFDEENALEHLGPFLSESFLGLYGMLPSQEQMTIVRRNMIVPYSVGSVPVLLGGQQLSWQLA